MTPPSMLPRLASLDPAAVAVEVCTLVAVHLGRLALHLAPAATLQCPEPTRLAAESDLGLTVRALVGYAQTGADPETSDPAIAAEYARDRILALSTCLDSSAWGGETVDLPELGAWGPADRGEPTTAIGIAMLAAWARAQLQAGEPVSTSEVAALSGVSLRQVARLVDSGEITSGKRGIAADEARRWLGTRGVLGVALCACGCGEPATTVARLVREQDRGTCDALRWAALSVDPMRVTVRVVEGHEGDVEGYVSPDDEG